jgi:hypothetical protein
MKILLQILFALLIASPAFVKAELAQAGEISRSGPAVVPPLYTGETTDNNVKDDMSEIIKHNQKIADSVNALNPLTWTAPKQSGTEPLKLDDKISLSSIPNWLPALMKFFTPKMAAAFEDVRNNPNRKYLFFGEIGLLLAVITLRSWRKSKAKNWFARFWITIWTSLVFFGSAVLILPWIFFGYSYFFLMQGIFLALIGVQAV